MKRIIVAIALLIASFAGAEENKKWFYSPTGPLFSIKKLNTATFNPLTMSGAIQYYSVDVGLRTTAGSSKNLLPKSEQYANGFWTPQAGLTFLIAQCTDPAGYCNATLVDNTGGSAAGFYNSSVTIPASTRKVLSVYTKRGPGHNGTSRAQLYLYTTCGEVLLNYVPTADWSRHQVVLPDTNACTTGQVWFTQDIDSPYHESVYVWGLFLEETAGDATAYEPTGTATNSVEVLAWKNQIGTDKNYARFMDAGLTYEANAIKTGQTSIKATTAQSVSLPTSEIPGLDTAFTYVSVHKAATGQAGSLSLGVFGRNDGGDWETVINYVSSSSKYKFQIADCVGAQYTELDTAVADPSAGVVLIARASSGGTMEMFLNGVSIGSQAAPVFDNTCSSFDHSDTIGGSNAGTIYLSAEMWLNRYVTDAEVTQLNTWFTTHYLP